MVVVTVAGLTQQQRYLYALALAIAVLLLGVDPCQASSSVSVEHYDGDASLEEAIDRFQKWYEEGYGPGLKVRLAPAGNGMRMGVFMTERTAAEQPYLAPPLSMVIGTETIFATPNVGPALKRLAPKLRTIRNPTEVLLGLFLLHERYVRGPSSFWAPYIALLPSALDTPSFYTPAEMEELKGMPVFESAEDLKQDTVQRYTQTVQRLLGALGLRDSGLFPDWAVNLDTWRWASGILGSRMIWWDNEPHLVPMLDFINCVQGPGQYARRVHRTQRAGNKAVTLAPWPFEKGDQVFENYGQPNPTYFLHHGFVIEPNVHDCAKIRWRQPATTQQLDEFFKADANAASAFSMGTPPKETLAQLRQRGVNLNDLCITKDTLDPILTIARTVTSMHHNRTGASGAQPLASRQQERRAVRLAVQVIEHTLRSIAPVPGTLLAAMRKLGTAQDEELAVPPLPSPMQKGRKAWVHAFGKARRAWASSEQVQELPFRTRMSLLYREGQRELLLGTSVALWERRPKKRASHGTKKEPKSSMKDEL